MDKAKKLLMGLFSFFKSSKFDKIAAPSFDPNGYVPILWEDGYRQVEIVPIENKDFVLQQIEEIRDLARKSRTSNGFTAAFQRKEMPVPMLTKEIRTDYLEETLLRFQFQKAKRIRCENGEILDCEKGKTKAFEFSSFTLFFETEDEFVKHIWMRSGLIVSEAQLDSIEAALYTLGEECEFMLVEWDSLAFYDLANKSDIQKYLMDYWK